MTHRRIDLSRARVLISNDDGVHSPGIKILETAVRAVAREVWVVAPEMEQSATSHSLTLRRPLRIRNVSDGRFAVDGTPTDSVLLGVHRVMRDARPDIVMSGVNRGGNLGEDVHYSGTVAAAMEGALLGIPSVAFSQEYDDHRNVIWETSEFWVPKILERLAEYAFDPAVFLNVNIPDCTPGNVTGMEVTRQGRRKIGGEIQDGRDPRGDAYYWVGVQRDEEKFQEGTDLDACRRKVISVTPLTLDLTAGRELDRLRGVFP
ncbi:MAG: 5'/3'-nucleotidase SurE [Rhodospirillales bacterium CG15_BIG_FIL_POST_REV_8_21_14_020_66_15]|nr:MAG: 5'/3'-nucleotidase SurE [Rhodospirillales bacterium CG15_BIG_FIL_POST_REV_8_21_14_020_66_15]